MEVFVEVSFKRVPWPILQALAVAGLRKTLENRADSGRVNAREERGCVASLEKCDQLTHPHPELLLFTYLDVSWSPDMWGWVG
jgi:hypothetical protein